MKALLVCVMGLFVAEIGLSTDIAVIDSGVDLKHAELAPKAWFNPGETADNGVDDEQNGYKDDVHGWNFAEKNNEIIDYKYLGTFSDDVYKFFEIQLKVIHKTATEEEISWAKGKAADETFVAELMKFGNFIHGTHVAGITAENADHNKIMAIKLIPTETPTPGASLFQPFLGETTRKIGFFKDLMIKMLMDGIVSQQAKMLVQVGQYVNQQQMKVANCSFGLGMTQARMIANQIFGIAKVENPTEEDTEKYAKILMEKMLTKTKGFIDAAPNTLFVIAAGNEGTNNDELPVSPANIKTDNTISVAATFDYKELAVFSNFGTKMVEVAAPGVGIRSAIPGDEYLHFSGTSQAAPAVANVAGQILNKNPDLTPKQVKEIIMGTVDYKGFLKNKITSGGMINTERAVYAAELSAEYKLAEAIEIAREKIRDVEVPDSLGERMGQAQPLFSLPLPSPIKLSK